MAEGAGRAAAPIAGARLEAVGGPHDGVVFPLRDDEMVIGREPDQDIPLVMDTMVSRTHARVVRSGGKIWLEDLDSSNGIVVNGKPIAGRVELAPGMIFRVGLTDLRFESGPTPRLEETLI